MEKLKELILWVAQESESDPKFGAVKLNKILFYADFIAYLELGHSITDATYQHLPEGPAPREFVQARELLLQEEAAHVESRRYFGKTQQRIVAARPPKEGIFSLEELRIIAQVIEELRPLSATQVSAMSHSEWGWKLTRVGETIRYETFWVSSEPLTEDQIAMGQKLAEEIGATL